MLMAGVFHCGAGILALMQNAKHLDLVGAGLVEVEDVLLDLEAATAKEAIVARATGFRVG